ncbi:chaperone protein DNAJ [Trypanosoma theileri]|uniref:Chaperone protein DNAJ n=1 Tax=Trypanosoma theileri TaxID=67003 RepID=A0A1X0NP50_9TRYP|nr:chaperone protein DNAJ [Trypanosoma theileri]ORC86492.1 chaperone protein DNAJ [Trypanosoma theileri]
MGQQEDQADEIRRLLQCAATKADAFTILQIEAETCELADINRSFRRIVLKVHPDKCTLAKAADAFHIAENAHKLLSNEAVLVRLKIAHQKKKEKEAALKEEASRRQASATTMGGSQTMSGVSGSVDEEGLTKEERTRRRRREQIMEQQLEAARLAEEAARKKQRVERETRERAELAAELERQRKEWKDLNLF